MEQEELEARNASGIMSLPKESTYRQDARSGLKDSRFGVLKSV